MSNQDTWQPLSVATQRVIETSMKRKLTPLQLQNEYERRRQVRRQRDRAATKTVAPFHQDQSAPPPPEVLAERDARMALEPQSITAAILGDPPIGRSALDRRQA